MVRKHRYVCSEAEGSILLSKWSEQTKRQRWMSGTRTNVQTRMTRMEREIKEMNATFSHTCLTTPAPSRQREKAERAHPFVFFFFQYNINKFSVYDSCFPFSLISFTHFESRYSLVSNSFVLFCFAFTNFSSSSSVHRRASFLFVFATWQCLSILISNVFFLGRFNLFDWCVRHSIECRSWSLFASPIFRHFKVLKDFVWRWDDDGKFGKSRR